MTLLAAVPQCLRHAAGAAIAALLMASLVACAAPVATAPAAPAPEVTPGAGSVPAAPIKVDTSCRTHADCTVKNVGNCCGYAPACVNVDSPTDPQGVQAECARSGRMSVCGFREISACQCVKGQCEPAAGGLDVQ